MRRTRLRRWGKKGPWLPRWREKERKRILAQGGVKVGNRAHQPKSTASIVMSGRRFSCLAAMLGNCYTYGQPLDRDHLFNRQVRGVGGCDCRANVPGYMCRRHHDMKHTMGREKFYGQHPDLWALYEIAKEHHRLRQRGELPCSPKWCAHRGGTDGKEETTTTVGPED